MLVYLLGFMGSGKSTLGAKVARRIGYSFHDLDTIIEEKQGKSISRLFEEAEESGFRAIEKEALHDTFLLKNTIIACGGGTPCFFDNMEKMNHNGLTVYLRLSPGSLFHRLAPQKLQRPLIASMPDLPLMEYIIRESESREVFYSQAGLIMKGENLKPEELAMEIQRLTGREPSN